MLSGQVMGELLRRSAIGGIHQIEFLLTGGVAHIRDALAVGRPLGVLNSLAGVAGDGMHGALSGGNRYQVATGGDCDPLAGWAKPGPVRRAHGYREVIRSGMDMI